MSSLRKRSGYWYLQWRENGKTVRKSLDIEIALDPKGLIATQKQAQHDRSAMLRGSGMEEESVTIREALDMFLAGTSQCSQSYQSDSVRRCNRWAVFFRGAGVDRVADIQPRHIQEYIDMRAEKVCGSVIQHDLMVIRAAVKLAGRKMARPISVDSWPKPPRAIARYPEKIGPYTQDEVNRIVEHFRAKPYGARWDLVIACLAYFGCRWSELEGLKIGDVDLDSEPPRVRLTNKKTVRSYSTLHRFVEIHPSLISGLREAVAGRGHDEQVFPGAKEPNLRQNMARVCKRLGIRYRKLHGLRHFFCTTLLRAGVPIPSVQAMSGHRSLAMIQRYLELPKESVGFVPGVFRPDPKIVPLLAGNQDKTGESSGSSDEKEGR